MNQLKNQRTYRRGHRLSQACAEDLWRHTLRRIDTVFGRLVYLASLRDNLTGTFHHYGLEQRYGQRRASRLIRDSYLDTLNAWVSLNPAEQLAEMRQLIPDL